MEGATDWCCSSKSGWWISFLKASLAQLAEHALRKRMVVGSIPTGGSLSCIGKLGSAGRGWRSPLGGSRFALPVALASAWSSAHVAVFNWPRGPMDKASAYGAGDCRFESCRGHFAFGKESNGRCQRGHMLGRQDLLDCALSQAKRPVAEATAQDLFATGHMV